MNFRIISAIARKDLLEITQDRSVWLPGLLFPAIVSVLMPLLILSMASHPMAKQTNQLPAKAVETMLAQLPPHLSTLFQQFSQSEQTALLLTGFFLAPMFLIIPLVLASIVGASAFVGEKERKTLEALLYTPATDAELLIGKLAAAVLPAIALSWASFLIYTVVVNAASWRLVGQVWFPTVSWWPLMIWVTPAVATLGIGVAVAVSVKAETFIEANQKTGIMVLPFVGLMAGQMSGVLFLSLWVSLLLGAAFWLIDVALVALAVKRFARQNLISRL